MAATPTLLSLLGKCWRTASVLFAFKAHGEAIQIETKIAKPRVWALLPTSRSSGDVLSLKSMLDKLGKSKCANLWLVIVNSMGLSV